MVKSLDTIIIYGAVMCTWWLVQVACIVIPDDHFMLIHKHLLGPGQEKEGDQVHAERGFMAIRMTDFIIHLVFISK